jgi:hypothetical protein
MSASIILLLALVTLASGAGLIAWAAQAGERRGRAQRRER